MASAARSVVGPKADVASFVSFLRAESIKCVIFDLDRTVVSMHSGGCVPRRQLAAFAQSMTPTVRALIPMLLAAQIRVAVATFADDLYSAYAGREHVAGVELVRSVLAQLECFQQAPSQLDQVPIVTINPGLYEHEAKRLSAAASQEQARMKSIAPAPAAASASAPAAASDGSASSALHTFFHSKLSAFGLDSSHPAWPLCSAFPPADFKNLHCQWIAAKLDLQLKELLLIDDRDENVEAAVEQGSWGCRLERKKGLELADLKNVIAPMKQPTEG